VLFVVGEVSIRHSVCLTLTGNEKHCRKKGNSSPRSVIIFSELCAWLLL
jgi:hypothetical protein